MKLRLLRQIAALLAVAALPALLCGAIQLEWKARPEPPLEAGEVRSATARQWGAHVLYVDARPQSRYDAGHIAGAVRLTEEEWETLVPRFLDLWDPDKTVVVYCDGGGCEASKGVAQRLEREMKIEGVYVLKGGYPEWSRK